MYKSPHEEVPLQHGVIRGKILNSGFQFKEENGVVEVK